MTNMTKRTTKTDQYLKTFFEEKALPFVEFEIRDSRFNVLHFISNEIVIESIMACGPREKKKIADKLRYLDFHNADINDFLRHLAKALVNNHHTQPGS